MVDLPAGLRRREWLRRVEAVLFATASPVPHEAFERLVEQEVSVDLQIEDLTADLDGRPYEVRQVGSG